MSHFVVLSIFFKPPPRKIIMETFLLQMVYKNTEDLNYINTKIIIHMVFLTKKGLYLKYLTNKIFIMF